MSNGKRRSKSETNALAQYHRTVMRAVEDLAADDDRLPLLGLLLSLGMGPHRQRRSALKAKLARS